MFLDGDSGLFEFGSEDVVSISVIASAVRERVSNKTLLDNRRAVRCLSGFRRLGICFLFHDFWCHLRRCQS